MAQRKDPTILQRMVVRIAEKGGGLSRAYAIATANLQRMGYFAKGTRTLTAAGRAKEAKYTADEREEARQGMRELGVNVGASYRPPLNETTRAPRGPVTKPMLAKVFTSLRAGHRYVVEPKIDGYRMLATRKGAKIIFTTRNGNANPYTRNLHRLGEQLLGWMRDGEVVDGEILVNDWSGTGVLRSDPPTRDEQKIIDSKAVFYVFDLPKTPGTLEKRRDELKKRAKGRNVSVLPQTVVQTNADVMRAAKKLASAGFEGAMVKDLDGAYSPRKRTSAFEKVKFKHDITAKIVGFERGTGKYANSLGALRVTAQGKTFKVGTGLSDKQRDAIWRNQHAYKGRSIEVTAQKDGAKLRLPRFPAFVRFRGEE